MRAAELIFQALLLLAPAVAETQDAVVYLSTNSASLGNEVIPTTRQLSPAAARLVFAQRLGLAEYYTLSSAGESILAAINDYGGVYRMDEMDRSTRLLILLDGVERPQDLFPSGRRPNFTISQPPNAQVNRILFEDFYSVSSDLIPSMSNANLAHQRIENALLRRILPLDVHSHHGGQSFVIHDFQRDQSDTFSAKTETSELGLSFESLFEEAEARHWDIILASFPPRSQSTTSHEGSYSLPNSAVNSQRQTRLERREEREFGSGRPDVLPGDHDHVETNTDNPPTVADLPLNATATHSYTGLMPTAAMAQSNSSRNTTAPRGILPACYSSQSSCESTTNFCSGHGSCSLKYSSEGESGAQSCWACACKSDQTKNDKGYTKTTRWGGPACQKQDVSSPFWLLAGSTIGLLGLVAFGMGQLYSMGDQELPSVIGAGVAGPRPK